MSGNYVRQLRPRQTERSVMKKSLRSVILLCLVVLLMAAVPAQSKKDGSHRHNKSGIAEVDHFHDALYPTWHDYYPNKQWDKIRGDADELARRSEAVMKLELKRKSAEPLRQKFGEAVSKFVNAAKSGNDKLLGQSVLRMHERFTAFLDEVRQK
jgi:hypothetical protein